MAEKHYNFEHEGEMFDIEANTKKQAEQWANEWFNSKCLEEDLQNGEVREDRGEIVEFVYNKNDEAIEKERTIHELFYEETRSDFAEHNTLRGL